MSIRIRLCVSKWIPNSLAAMVGVLQLNASFPSAVLRLRRSNSTCHRSLSSDLRAAFGTCCGQFKVVTRIFHRPSPHVLSEFQMPRRNMPDSSRAALPWAFSTQSNDNPTPKTFSTKSLCYADELRIVRAPRPRVDIAVHTTNSRLRSRHCQHNVTSFQGIEHGPEQRLFITSFAAKTTQRSIQNSAAGEVNDSHQPADGKAQSGLLPTRLQVGLLVGRGIRQGECSAIHKTHRSPHPTL